MNPLHHIHLHDLEVWCHVGVPEIERAQPQRLLLNIDLKLDLSPCQNSDDLKSTVDYSAVYQSIHRQTQAQSWVLIERLAWDLAKSLSIQFNLPAVQVEVKKFILPSLGYVSVTVEHISHATPLPSQV